LIRFPGLAQLSHAYLGTWDYEYGSPEAAVADFIASSPSNVASAADGLRAILTEFATEREREEILDVIDWGFMPEDVEERDQFLLWAEAQLSNAATD
jgi:hypothetical protein